MGAPSSGARGSRAGLGSETGAREDRQPLPSSPAPGWGWAALGTIQTSELGPQCTRTQTSQTTAPLHIYTATHAQTYTRELTSSHTSTYAQTHTDPHTHSLVHTYARSHIRTYSHTHMQTHTHCTHPSLWTRRLSGGAQPAPAHGEETKHWEPASRAPREGAQASHPTSCTTRPCSPLQGWAGAQPFPVGLD